MVNPSFNVAPYFSDGPREIDQNYMQLLFNPARALQARELTVLQSILQNQISQVGEFVLADGSPVTGGHVSFDGTVQAIQLQQQFANTDINLSDFFVNGNNTLIINASGATTIKAVVVGVDNSQVNPVIIVKYLTGTTFPDNSVIQVATGVQSQAQLIASGASSPASVASISSGIFFSGGFFVTINPTTIVLSSNTATPNCFVGLQIQEAIVTSTSDTTLLDPAQGSFNFQAPGADRFQYDLVLSFRTFTSTDTSAFYSLVTIENGLITSQIEYPVLGTINNTLAKRTYDTNGDFVVKPFIVTTGINSANANQYSLIVSPGEAFVKGYEYETVGTTRLFADKALATNTITDYSFSTEFGNILTVTNLHPGNTSGSFNIAAFQNVDLHVVTSGSINNASSGTYNATKIGTAQIRDVEFLGLGDYFAYVLNVNIVPNTVIAVSGSSNTVNLGASFLGIAPNALANVLTSVATGSFIDNRVITSFNSATAIATLNNPLSTPANNTSNVSLNFGIKDLNSLVISPSVVGNSYATQGTGTTPFDACMDIAFAGKDITGNTILSDTNFNKLIFPLPQAPVAQGTIANASFTARVSNYNAPFTNSNFTLTLTGSQVFPFGFDDEFLTDIAANTNFIVQVRNAGGSGLSNGEVLIMDRNALGGSTGNGVFQVSPTEVVLFTSGNGGTFTADIYYTIGQDNATSVVRSKTLRGNSSNVTLASTDTYLNGNFVVGLTGTSTDNVFIDMANGFVWFVDPAKAAVATAPGQSQSLFLPDVFNVIKVYDSGNPLFAPNNTNAIDITNNYYLNSGQNDNYYDFASLTLAPGANAPTGQTVVMLQYFQHGTANGFFDADSYSSTVYNAGLIPYYNSPAFGTFSLRDSIDFRPTRANALTTSVATFQLFGLELPQPDNTFQLSYQFFLPRIDKLMLNKNGQFIVKEGIPSQYPVTPADSSDAMTLYIVSVPAFTPNVQQIGLQYVENKRYTMKDIGGLASRITQLEYYSNLSTLEQRAAAETITYQDGVTPKPQYGVLADDFGDFSYVDNQSQDLRCYFQQGTLSPFKLQTPLAFNLSSNTAPFSEGARTFALPFTEVPAVVQNAATTAVTVQPFLFAQFTGTLKLTPETDYWFSSRLVPQIIAPPTANPALPPLPKPVAAPALVPTANVAPPSPPVVAGTLVATFNLWGLPTFYFAPVSTGLSAVQIQVSSASYGVVSSVSNWFGTPTSAVAPASTSTTNMPETGSSIQLNNGSTVTNSTTISPAAIKVL
jgi:Domain of unknown function (DUF4815)